MAKRLTYDEARLTPDQADQVAANLGLVGQIARSCAGGDPHLMDLYFQAGAIGLGRGVQKFDPARGVKLSHYVKYHIRQQIQVERNRNRMIRLGRDVLNDREALDAAPRATVAADLEDWDPDDAGRSRNPWAVEDLDDDVAPLSYGGSLDREDREALESALERLPERERLAIRGRLQGLTLRAVGETLGVTRERARKITTTAIAKLRSELAD